MKKKIIKLALLALTLVLLLAAFSSPALAYKSYYYTSQPQYSLWTHSPNTGAGAGYWTDYTAPYAQSGFCYFYSNYSNTYSYTNAALTNLNNYTHAGARIATNMNMRNAHVSTMNTKYKTNSQINIKLPGATYSTLSPILVYKAGSYPFGSAVDDLTYYYRNNDTATVTIKNPGTYIATAFDTSTHHNYPYGCAYVCIFVVEENKPTLTNYSSYYYAEYSPTSMYIYKSNTGGTVSISSATQSSGYVAAYAYHYPNTGYRFSHWSASNSNSYYNASSTYCLLLSRVAGTVFTPYFTANNYTLTYNANGGSVSPANKTVTYNAAYGTLPTPTRAGYTFAGWYTAASGGSAVNASTIYNTAGNTTIYARWTPSTYTWTFNANGGTVGTTSASVAYLSSFTLPTPSRAGYTFKGWLAAGIGTFSGTIPNNSPSNVTFTAQWEANKYTWSYNANGGTVNGKTSDSVQATIHTNITLPTPVRTGYTFNYWTANTGGNFTGTIPNNSTQNVTFTANWTANKYTWTFNANGGTVSPSSVQATYWQNATMPTPTRTGYTFAGWKYGSSTFWGQSYQNQIAGNATFSAAWTANTYTINYHANGGSGSMSAATHTYDAAKALTANSFTRAQHSFLGWSTSSSATAPLYTNSQSVRNLATANGATVNLYAVWVQTEDLVYFNYNGGSGSPASRTYQTNTTYGALPEPTRLGYTFDGWYTQATGGTQVLASSPTPGTAQAVYLYAHWTQINYTWTFDANGGTVSGDSSVNAPYWQNVTMPEATREGHTFLGWKYSTTVFAPGLWHNQINGDATFEGQWKADIYTLTFDPAGGLLPEGTDSAIQVTYDEQYGALPVPTRTGYYFDGWEIDQTSIAAGGTIAITADSAATAQWEAKKFDVTFDAGAGAFPATRTKSAMMVLSQTPEPIVTTTIEQTYGQAYEKPTAPTRRGYAFVGWQRNGEDLGDNEIFASLEPETLTARWAVDYSNFMFWVTTDEDATGEGYDSFDEAIAAANASNGTNIVISLHQDGVFGGTDLNVAKNVTIRSAGDATYTISRAPGATNSRLQIAGGDVTIQNIIFNGGSESGAAATAPLIRVINSNSTLTLTGVTLQNNANSATAYDSPGAIYNAGTLNMDGSNVINSCSSAGLSGAIYNTGILTLSGTTLQNIEYAEGGGVINNAGTLNQSAGAIRGDLLNNGAANLSGGQLTGDLLTSATVNVGAYPVGGDIVLRNDAAQVTMTADPADRVYSIKLAEGRASSAPVAAGELGDTPLASFVVRNEGYVLQESGENLVAVSSAPKAVLKVGGKYYPYATLAAAVTAAEAGSIGTIYIVSDINLSNEGYSTAVPLNIAGLELIGATLELTGASYTLDEGASRTITGVKPAATEEDKTVRPSVKVSAGALPIDGSVFFDTGLFIDSGASLSITKALAGVHYALTLDEDYSDDTVLISVAEGLSFSSYYKQFSVNTGFIEASSGKWRSANSTGQEPELRDGFYQIKTAANLAWFASQVNNQNKTDINAELQANVVLTTPEPAQITIGSAEHPYNGVFDGRGYTVDNSDTPLFGTVSGTVKNITVDSGAEAAITTLTETGTATNAAQIGGGALVATNSGKVENCYVTGDTLAGGGGTVKNSHAGGVYSGDDTNENTLEKLNNGVKADGDGGWLFWKMADGIPVFATAQEPPAITGDNPKTIVSGSSMVNLTTEVTGGTVAVTNVESVEEDGEPQEGDLDQRPRKNILPKMTLTATAAPGYTFTEWTVTPPGSVKALNGQAPTGWTVTVQASAGTAEIAPVFTPIEYEITLDPNGTDASVAPTSINVNYGELYFSELPTPSLTDNTFDGWFTAATDGDKITADTAYTATSDIILYAHWTANANAVRFWVQAEGLTVTNLGTGAVAVEGQANTYSTLMTLPEILEMLANNNINTATITAKRDVVLTTTAPGNIPANMEITLKGDVGVSYSSTGAEALNVAGTLNLTDARVTAPVNVNANGTVNLNNGANVNSVIVAEGAALKLDGGRVANVTLTGDAAINVAVAPTDYTINLTLEGTRTGPVATGENAAAAFGRIVLPNGSGLVIQKGANGLVAETKNLSAVIEGAGGLLLPFNSLQDAIDDAIEGGTVYLIGDNDQPLTVNKDLTLSGAMLSSAGNLILKGAQSWESEADITVAGGKTLSLDGMLTLSEEAKFVLQAEGADKAQLDIGGSRLNSIYQVELGAGFASGDVVVTSTYEEAPLTTFALVNAPAKACLVAAEAPAGNIIYSSTTAEAQPTAGVDFANRRLTGLTPGAQYKYTVSGDTTEWYFAAAPEMDISDPNYVEPGTAAIPEAMFGGSITLVKVSTGAGSTDSPPQTLSVPAIPALVSPALGEVGDDSFTVYVTRGQNYTLKLGNTVVPITLSGNTVTVGESGNDSVVANVNGLYTFTGLSAGQAYTLTTGRAATAFTFAADPAAIEVTTLAEKVDPTRQPLIDATAALNEATGALSIVPDYDPTGPEKLALTEQITAVEQALAKYREGKSIPDTTITDSAEAAIAAAKDKIKYGQLPFATVKGNMITVYANGTTVTNVRGVLAPYKEYSWAEIRIIPYEFLGTKSFTTSREFLTDKIGEHTLRLVFADASAKTITAYIAVVVESDVSLDRTVLAAAIKEAQTLHTSTKANMTDVTGNEKWADQAALDAFNERIASAQTASRNALNQGDIDAALALLQADIEQFQQARKYGDSAPSLTSDGASITLHLPQGAAIPDSFSYAPGTYRDWSSIRTINRTILFGINENNWDSKSSFPVVYPDGEDTVDYTVLVNLASASGAIPYYLNITAAKDESQVAEARNELQTEIQVARELINATYISNDEGKNGTLNEGPSQPLTASDYWVTSGVKTAFSDNITIVEGIYGNPYASESELRAAHAAIITQAADFRLARQSGRGGTYLTTDGVKITINVPEAEIANLPSFYDYKKGAFSAWSTFAPDRTTIRNLASAWDNKKSFPVEFEEGEESVDYTVRINNQFLNITVYRSDYTNATARLDLERAIVDANELNAATEISDDGMFLLPSQRWVTAAEKEDFARAIASAAAVSELSGATTADYQAEQVALEKAIADFNSKRQAGRNGPYLTTNNTNITINLPDVNLAPASYSYRTGIHTGWSTYKLELRTTVKTTPANWTSKNSFPIDPERFGVDATQAEYTVSLVYNETTYYLNITIPLADYQLARAKQDLASQISAADILHENTVGTDGERDDPTVYYVSLEQYNAFDAAITAAETARDSLTATVSSLTKAQDDLVAAQQIYEDARKLGGATPYVTVAENSRTVTVHPNGALITEVAYNTGKRLTWAEFKTDRTTVTKKATSNNVSFTPAGGEYTVRISYSSLDGANSAAKHVVINVEPIYYPYLNVVAASTALSASIQISLDGAVPTHLSYTAGVFTPETYDENDGTNLLDETGDACESFNVTANGAYTVYMKTADGFEKCLVANVTSIAAPDAKSGLANLLAQARALRDQWTNKVIAPENEATVPVGTQYVRQGDYEIFVNAINAASDFIARNDTTETQIADATTILSTAKSTFENCVQTGSYVDRTVLNSALTNARKMLATAVASANGEDVLVTRYWVLPNIHSDLTAAIAAAEALPETATQSEVNVEARALNAARVAFSNAKVLGTKEVITVERDPGDPMTITVSAAEGSVINYIYAPLVATGGDYLLGLFPSWATLRVYPRVNLVKTGNTITYTENGIYTLMVNYTDAGVTAASFVFLSVEDLTPMTAECTRAMAQVTIIEDTVTLTGGAVRVSALNGADVPAGEYWITPGMKNTLQNAITAADAALIAANGSEAAGQQREHEQVLAEAILDLQSAIARAEEAKQPGTQTEGGGGEEPDPDEKIASLTLGDDGVTFTVDGQNIKKYFYAPGRYTSADYKAFSLVRTQVYPWLSNKTFSAQVNDVYTVQVYFSDNTFVYITSVSAARNVKALKYDISKVSNNALPITVSGENDAQVSRVAWAPGSHTSFASDAFTWINYPWSFSLISNGTYTIYAQDTDGKEYYWTFNVNAFNTPTFRVNGNDVEIYSNGCTIVTTAYATGEYDSWAAMYAASDTNNLRYSPIDTKVSGLAAGTYTFCVRYNGSEYAVFTGTISN